MKTICNTGFQTSCFEIVQTNFNHGVSNTPKHSLIFRTISDDADKLSKQLGILNKSFYDIKKDFSNGLGIKNSLFKIGISEKDLSSLKSFNNAIKNTNDGLTKSQRITKAWDDNMNGCSIAAKRLGNDLVTGKKRIQDINVTMKSATLSTKALGVAMNIASNVAFMLAVSAITKVVTELTQAQSKAVEIAQEATQTYKDEIKTIDDYKQKIAELQTELNFGNLSYEDAKTKRSELMTIQDELIAKYGTEKSAIESITSAIGGQVDALDSLNESQYREWLANADNQSIWNKLATNGKSGLDQAIDFMETNKTVSIMDLQNANLSDDIQAIQKEIDDTIQSKYNLDKFLATFSVNGTPDEIKSTLESIRQDYIDLSKDAFIKNGISSDLWEVYRKEAIDSINEVITKYDEGIQKHQETYQTYMEGKIKYDSDYSDEYEDILAKRSNLEQAETSGDADAIAKARKEMIDAIGNGIASAGDNENIKKYFENLYPELQAEFSEWTFELDLKANIDGLQDVANELGEKYSATDLLEMLNTNGIQDGEDAFNSLIDKAVEYGVCTDNSAEEVQKLINLLVELGIIQGEVQSSTSNNKTPLSFTDAISQVQALSKGLDQLDKIYADVYDKEEFDWSSILNNEDFKTVFGELGDVYDNFISTVSNSPDDITACQNAFDNLSTAYIYNSGVLDDVTESTKTATIAMLEQLGIANATELVENALAVQKQFLAGTGIELANATYEEIAAFLAESDATDDTKQALAAYQLQKELAAGLTLDTSGDIENLQNLVKACGGAATALSTLNKIKSGNLSGVNMYGGKENRDALIRLAEQEVQDALNKVSSASSTATNKVKYGGGTSAKKAKESASKSANGSKDTSKTYNWVETAIERVERSLKKLSETASSVYKNWTNRNNALASEVTKTTEALNLQQSAYQTYMNEADKVGLSDTYQALIQNGGLRIEDITDEKLQQQIETYKDYYTKALSAADSVDELTKSLSELAKTKFDNVVSEFDDALSLIEHRADMLSASIDQTEKKGYIVSKNYYEALIISQTSNLTKLQEEYSALTSSFEEAMNTGRIEQYSEAWYDMAGDINQVEKALTDARTSLIEYENSMRELNWSNFDKLQDYIGDITKETDFLSSLISDKKLYDDYGNLNDNGYSEMGLYGISYNALMNQADKYGEELKRINKELAEDPYNQILIDRQRELAEAQRNVVSSAMDEKDAIINLIKEAYDAQLDSLQKIIDKKKDALNAAKDLYDYENSIAEQTKKVADYRKQLIAYSGDDSEESKALVQQLTTNLADAEKALQETEYNKWKSDQEQMLDTLYSDYESLINERMDNTDGLLQDAINVINEKSDIISDTVTTAANDVGIVLSEPLESILIENRGTKDLISLYGNDFTARWTTTNDAVNGITNKVADMINASNAQSQSIISAISTAANSIVSVRQAEIAAYTPPSPSTNNSGNSGSSGNSSNGSSSNNKGDSSGSSPSGNKGNSISSGKLYYVVDRDGYALSPGYKTIGEAMRNVSTYRGVDISSIYKKKLYPFDPFGGNMNLFANGGVVKPTSKTTGLDKIAQSFGEDHIVAVRNNERLLTPVQNNSFEALAKCAPDLIKSLTENNIPYLNLTPKNTILPSRPVSNQSVSVNIDAVQVNGVNDPQKFANELVSNLKSNTRVQNTLKDLTVTSMLGGNSLLVNRN